MDPLAKEYPFYTPYQFASNTPIWAIDVDGLEDLIATIHGSWWQGQINNYLEKGDEESALAAIIVGSLLIHKSMVDSKQYADNNWGVNKQSPISIEVNNMEVDGLMSIRKQAQEKGEVSIELRYTPHTETGHVKTNSDIMIGTTLLIRDAKGFNDESGFVGWVGTVYKYLGFPKMFGHIGQDRDIWTGDKLDTRDRINLTVGGIADLLTMGKNPTSALMNIGLNSGQEGLENFSPEMKEEIGVLREAIDLSRPGHMIEMVSNMVQAGMVSQEIADKFLNTTLQDQIKGIKKENHIMQKKDLIKGNE
ncbi:MAG TPA: hypothetical protein ENJ28_09400 [Gammaproteobacteria bacterium]|nr:hypothetical protein [Gammaproteobacteria bacterium]